jgi:gamma-glutamylaminecyclotransferase
MAPEPDASATFTLFVYGTLMRDGCRAAVLAGQRFLGAASTRPAYELIDLGAYPGLIPCAADGRSIEGELFEVDTDLLPRLDAIEGAPDLFRLAPVQIEGRVGPILTYLYQQDTRGRNPCRGRRWDNGRGS